MRETERPRVAVMLTCYNRKEKTINCIKTIAEGNPDMDFLFVVADDASTDGTAAALKELPYRIILLEGTGSLFWNGGMRMSFQYALDSVPEADCYLLVNDDVSFLPGTINSLYLRLKMVNEEAKRMCCSRAVATGAMKTTAGEMTYGGIVRTSRFFVKYLHVRPGKEIRYCDSFNGNCVMVPRDIFREIGNLDPKYIHSMSDFDYGFTIRKAGYRIINSEEFTGICSDNEVKNSWRDASLSRKKRLELKNSPKGLPTGDWFHFVRKNYGFVSAIYHFLTPYIRIMIGK